MSGRASEWGDAMTAIAVRRRRWPWVVISVVLLIVGVPLAWKFRPLNATERKLVGVWSRPKWPGKRIILEGDRTFLVFDPGPERLCLTERRKWRASESGFFIDLEPSSIAQALEWLLEDGDLSVGPESLQLDGSERVWIDGELHIRTHDWPPTIAPEMNL